MVAHPIIRSNLPYGPGVPYCSDNELKVCPLMRSHKDEDLSKCDNCDNYPYKKPIYTQAELLEGATRNKLRRAFDILERLENTLPEEMKDKIIKKAGNKIIVEKFFLIPEPKKIICKKKEYKKIKINPTPSKVHSIGPIPLKNTDKRYCLSCLYLPNNCLCGVKINGELTEIHITDKACPEYKDQVF